MSKKWLSSYPHEPQVENCNGGFLFINLFNLGKLHINDNTKK